MKRVMSETTPIHSDSAVAAESAAPSKRQRTLKRSEQLEELIAVTTRRNSGQIVLQMVLDYIFLHSDFSEIDRRLVRVVAPCLFACKSMRYYCERLLTTVRSITLTSGGLQRTLLFLDWTQVYRVCAYACVCCMTRTPFDKENKITDALFLAKDPDLRLYCYTCLSNVLSKAPKLVSIYTAGNAPAAVLHTPSVVNSHKFEPNDTAVWVHEDDYIRIVKVARVMGITTNFMLAAKNFRQNWPGCAYRKVDGKVVFFKVELRAMRHFEEIGRLIISYEDVATLMIEQTKFAKRLLDSDGDEQNVHNPYVLLGMLMDTYDGVAVSSARWQIAFVDDIYY